MERVLVVSLGSIGKRHIKNTRELIPSAEICVWRRNLIEDLDQPKDLKIVTTKSEALAFKPDAVILSSPAVFHAEQASIFVEKEIPLFIEKPLTHSPELTAPLKALADVHQSLIFIGYVLRFQPIMVRLKSLIDCSFIGEVLIAEITAGQYLPDWRPNSDYRLGVSAQAELGGGVLLELSHEIDYALWLFGKPENVYADVRKLSDLEIDVEDCATIIMSYPDKKVVIATDFLQRAPMLGLKLIGTKKTAIVNLLEETIETIDADGKRNRELLKMESGNEMYLRQFDEFFSLAFHDYKKKFDTITDYSTLRDGSDVIDLIDKCRKSATSGTRV